MADAPAADMEAPGGGLGVLSAGTPDTANEDPPPPPVVLPSPGAPDTPPLAESPGVDTRVTRGRSLMLHSLASEGGLFPHDDDERPGRLSRTSASSGSTISRSSSISPRATAAGDPTEKLKRNAKTQKQLKQVMTQLAAADFKGLCAYIPRVLLSTIKAKKKLVAEKVPLHAASLFIDMCKYTFITEQMRKSEDGSNGIATHLNKFFTVLLSEVSRYNGDVLQFSGDALLAIWPCREEDGGDLKECATKALLCAKGLLDMTANEHIQFSANEEPIRLGVHMSLGVGPMVLHTLGGYDNSWRYMTSGQGVLDSVLIVDLAKMDEIVISPAAHELLASIYTGEEVADSAGHSAHKVMTVQEGAAPPADEADRLVEEWDEPEDEHDLATITESTKYRVFCFLFDTILSTWGKEGELRTVSTLFIHFLQQDGPNSIAVIQSTLEIIQAELLVRDGVLNKVQCDDKGVTLLCIFGLPGHAHEDDILRALTFASKTKMKVDDEDQVALAYGISRAKVYCGQCGSKGRREYTVLGDGVNVAARVMQHAAKEARRRAEAIQVSPDAALPPLDSIIFCDDTTRQAGKDKFRFAGGEVVTVKGKSMGMKLWEVADMSRQRLSSMASSGGRGNSASIRRSPSPANEMDHSNSACVLGDREPGDVEEKNQVKMVGRDQLLVAIKDAVLKGTKGKPEFEVPLKAKTIMLQGEAGIGKTLALRIACDVMKKANAEVLYAQCSSMEADTPYYVLSILLARIIEDVTIEWLCEDIDAVDSDLRPLLNHLFPGLGFDMNERVAILSDKEQLGALLDIAVGLIHRSFNGTPVLFVVDDLQFADRESQLILLHMLESCANTAILMSKRHDVMGDEDDEDDEDRHEAFPPESCTSVLLQPLSKTDTANLLRNVMRAPVHDQVTDLVHRKSGGNPGFSEQILSALQDASPPVLVVSEKRVGFASGVDVNNIQLPDGIEGVISARVDRLPQTLQSYLKVASVVGTVFSMGLLSRVLHIDSVTLVEEFAELQKQGFVAQKKMPASKQKQKTYHQNRRGSRRQSSQPDLMYAFKLQLMADVLYQMLLPRERRQIHIDVARELEIDIASGAQIEPQVLILHFRKGGEHTKAIKYLVEAGERTLEKGRPHSCVQHLTQALQICRQQQDEEKASDPSASRSHSVQHAEERTQEERLHWLALLAQGYCALGQFDKVRECAEEVLQAYGEPMAMEGCGLTLANMKMRLQQMFASPVLLEDTGADCFGERDLQVTLADNGKDCDLLLCYHALAMAAWYGTSIATTNFYAMRGLLIGARMGDYGPLIKGKRGVLYIISDLGRGAGMIGAVDVSGVLKHGKMLYPPDHGHIDRFGAIYFAHNGLARTIEHRLGQTARVSFAADLNAQNMLALNTLTVQALHGQPEEAVKGLADLGRQAASVQDKRTETYCDALALYINIFITGAATTDGLMQALGKIKSKVRDKEQTLSEWGGAGAANSEVASSMSRMWKKGTEFRSALPGDAVGVFVDRTLAALCEAVSAAVSMRIDRPRESLDRAERAMGVLHELRHAAPSTFRVLALHATLECMMDEANLAHLGKDHSYLTRLLKQLDAMADDISAASPAYFLMEAVYEVRVRRNVDRAYLCLAQALDCAKGMRIPYFAARAYAQRTVIMPSTSSAVLSAECHKIKELYARAGTGRHLQEFYGLPDGA
eukprot:TRINITY_DN27437_c0_g1_i1.p1 TRINITY_DN27437_c0_g1~~TRINITY_DN27437_c0_g1_i1.p1  ORF type:complete len:1679 (+),score=607.86 TRINITY_DN27437_c0_g1_i1:75-5111(+)